LTAVLVANRTGTRTVNVRSESLTATGP